MIELNRQMSAAKPSDNVMNVMLCMRFALGLMLSGLGLLQACEVCGGDPYKKSEHEAALALVPVANATTTAVRSGAWSDAATWSAGVPGAEARVVIPRFIEVTYDVVSTTRLNWIRVDGVMRYATQQNTALALETIIVTPQGRYEQGTARDPIPAQYTSSVQFVDNGAINRIYDPRELSRGLVSNGSADIHGAEKKAWLACATFPSIGDTSFRFASSPAGWRVGDRLVIHGSYLRERTWMNPDASGQGFPTSNHEDEVRTITAINGAIVSFTEPLIYEHAAPRPTLQVYVGNMTRNIVYYSENTDYTSNAAMHRHGHVMFMHVGTVNVAWARFQDLGRTNKAIWIDDVTVENADVVIPGAKTMGTGTNVKGRYALHFHRCGVDQLGAPPVMNVGTVVENGTGWGMVNHTSYVIMDQCLVYNMPGAGFVEEGGQGTGVFRRCLAIGMRGTGREAEDIVIPDLGFNGIGFFFRGNNADLEDCVAASCAFTGYHWRNKGFGHASSNAANRDPLPATALRHPEIANGRPSIPWEEAQTTRFNRCDAIACLYGVNARYWMLAEGGGGPKALLHDGRQEITGMRIWGVVSGSFELNYSPRVTIRDALVLSELRQKPQLPYEAKAPVGIAMDLNNDEEVYDNVHVSGFKLGLSVIKDVNGFTNLRYYLLDNCNFSGCDTAIDTHGPNPITNVAQASVDLTRLRFDANPTGAFPDGTAISSGLSVSGTKWDSIGATTMTPLYGYEDERFHFTQIGLQNIIAKGYYRDGAGTHLMLPCMVTDRVSNRVKVTYVRQAFDPAANPGLIVGPDLGAFQEQGKAAWKINCGGSVGSGFASDQMFTSGTQKTTSRAIDTSLVSHPAPDALYQSARTGSQFRYTLNGLTPGALYSIRLHFAEIEETTVGKRVFDVLVNGVTMLTSLDILGLTGTRDVALVKEVIGQADASGILIIECVGGKSLNPEALLSGFEILSGLLSAKVPNAVLNVPPGVYARNQTVSLFNPLPFAKMYFTTDGSTPTTTSRLWGSPILVSGPTQIRVLSTSGTLIPSLVSGFYNIAQGSADGLINGSFENPTIEPGLNVISFGSNIFEGVENMANYPYGWTTPVPFWNTDPAIVRGSADGFPAPTDGLQLARLRPNASISQVIQPAAGSYKIRVRAGYTLGWPPGTLQFTVNGGAAGQAVLPSPALTTVESTPFTVTTGQSITIGLASSAGEVCIDQVEVVPATAGAFVRLTSPAAGSMAGAPLAVVLTADARSYTGTVARVEFYNGTTLLGQSTATPASMNWTNVAAGSYALTARVYDSVGQVANSATVSLTVLPPLPTIVVTTPTHGASLTTGPLALSASATGTLASVSFLVDGSLVGSDATSPYGTSWQASNGIHHIQAVATDTSGQQSVSAAVVIAISGGGVINTAPTISAIADQSTPQDTPKNAITFTIADGQTAAGSLTLNASSSNPILVPVANVSFGGTGASRTVSVTPAVGQSGTATITVVVSDGSLTASEPFTLTVTATATAPSTPVITSATTAAGTVGNAFSYAITATNMPNSFTITDLPPGLIINASTGVISGTPTTAGITVTTIKAVNGAGTGSASLTIAMAASIAGGGVPPVTTGGTGVGDGVQGGGGGGNNCGLGSTVGVLTGFYFICAFHFWRRRSQSTC